MVSQPTNSPVSSSKRWVLSSQHLILWTRKLGPNGSPPSCRKKSSLFRSTQVFTQSSHASAVHGRLRLFLHRNFQVGKETSQISNAHFFATGTATHHSDSCILTSVLLFLLHLTVSRIILIQVVNCATNNKSVRKNVKSQATNQTPYVYFTIKKVTSTNCGNSDT